MKWSLPPQSRCGNYKLVAIDKIDSEIYLVLIGDGIGAIKQRLSDLQVHSCDYLKGYVVSLLPDILNGAYDVDLILE